MQRQYKIFTGIAGIIVASGFATADVVTDRSLIDGPALSVGFEAVEGFRPGDAVQRLSFGNGLSATLSTSRDNQTNRVIEGTDGLGAIATTGDQFLKLRSGTAEFDFLGDQLSAFGFDYSDLEWSDFRISVDGGDPVTLSDDNPNDTAFWAYQADEGESFSRISIEWTRRGDGIGFDNITAVRAGAAVPGPSALAVFGLGAIAVSRRRRSASD